MIYGPSKYKNEKWEKGYLKINPDYSMNIEYKPNMNSIQERWKASLRKDLSVIAFAILAILFIIMNMSETLFLRMSEYVMLGYLFVVSVIYIRNICSSYQERLRLEKLFLRRTQDEEDEFRN